MDFLKKYKYWYIGGAIGIIFLVVIIIILSKRKKVAKYAQSFTGTNEIAGNLGWTDKQFQEKMAKAGWQRGEQWCMYFSKMVWIDKYPNKADIINKTLTGSSQISYENAAKDTTGNFEVTEKPKVGDIVIWERLTSDGFKTGTGHAGIVSKVNGNEFTTIEGNTSDSRNSSDGGTVAMKNRDLEEYKKTTGLRLRGFIRKK